MSTAKPEIKQLTNELKTAKKTIQNLKDDFAKFKASCMQDMNLLIEDAYVAGYSDAVQDFDKKTEAMEKYMEKAMIQFEKEYGRKIQKQGCKKSKK